MGQTSPILFLEIIEGRKKLPSEFFYTQFLSGPYVLVVVRSLPVYAAHPWMMPDAVLLK
jgi:hypothetical protein